MITSKNYLIVEGRIREEDTFDTVDFDQVLKTKLGRSQSITFQNGNNIDFVVEEGMNVGTYLVCFAIAASMELMSFVRNYIAPREGKFTLSVLE